MRRSRGDLLDTVGRDAVLFEKARQRTVRIEHEGPLVGAVDVALEHAFHQRRGRMRRDFAGTQGGDLPLEHEIQRIDADFVLAEVQQVVRVVRAVFPAVGVNAVVDRRERVAEQVA